MSLLECRIENHTPDFLNQSLQDPRTFSCYVKFEKHCPSEFNSTWLLLSVPFWPHRLTHPLAHLLAVLLATLLIMNTLSSWGFILNPPCYIFPFTSLGICTNITLSVKTSLIQSFFVGNTGLGSCEPQVKTFSSVST